MPPRPSSRALPPSSRAPVLGANWGGRLQAYNSGSAPPGRTNAPMLGVCGRGAGQSRTGRRKRRLRRSRKAGGEALKGGKQHVLASVRVGGKPAKQRRGNADTGQRRRSNAAGGAACQCGRAKRGRPRTGGGSNATGKATTSWLRPSTAAQRTRGWAGMPEHGRWKRQWMLGRGKRASDAERRTSGLATLAPSLSGRGGVGKPPRQAATETTEDDDRASGARRGQWASGCGGQGGGQQVAVRRTRGRWREAKGRGGAPPGDGVGFRPRRRGGQPAARGAPRGGHEDAGASGATEERRCARWPLYGGPPWTKSTDWGLPRQREDRPRSKAMALK